MKLRSLVASSILSFSLLVGGSSVFAETISQTSNTILPESINTEVGVMASSYEFDGPICCFNSEPPATYLYNDGRGYIGWVTLQRWGVAYPGPGLVGIYKGTLYYQY
ncbi:hypothetical protein MKY48_26515 [Paenibacillus sp. FSL W8-0187]|uniref:hypothetical protein n=1 Tax=Paenibacillus sp. FSL W8-0187 TaxID=2921710 RepID=UPI0030D750EC